MRVHPHAPLGAINELNFVTLRRRLAGQTPVDGLASHGPVSRPNQIGDRSADELLRTQSKQVRRNPIGKNDSIAVHEHHFRHGVREIMEQRLALPHLGVFTGQRVEQLIDRRAELREFRRGFQLRDAFAKRGAFCDVDDLPVQRPNLPGILTAFAPEPRASDGKAQTKQYRGDQQPGLCHGPHKCSIADASPRSVSHSP